MDVLFITPTDKPGLKQEVNGIMLLATRLLQAGYDADIIRFCQIGSFNKDYGAFLNEITDQIVSRAPKCVSFYSIWPSFHIALRIAQCVKQAAPHIHIVFGGPLVSLYPETVMEHISWIDYICTGEGENTIVPFVQALLSGAALDSVCGLYYRRNGMIVHNDLLVPLCDLNELPHWDARLFPSDPRDEANIHSARYYMPIDAGRGCPYNCTFCCSCRFWLRTYRLKSAEKILDEIQNYYNNYGIRSFMFSHDAFTANNRLVSEVCDRILESGLDITWNCTTRADCVTKDLLLKMKKAGMRRIQLGVETGSVRMQRLINKNLDLNIVKDLVSFLLENKIRVTLFFMYGFPEETEADLQDTLSLIFPFIDMGVQLVTMSFCNFSPATQITLDHYDDLTFEPEIAVSPRGAFGYDEEMEMIEGHKPLFPFFYHLNTPLRNQYLFMNCLVELYQMLPKAARIVRRLYKGDDLQLYRDLVRNNEQCFSHYMSDAMTQIHSDPVEVLKNTIKDFDHPRIDQVNSLIQFIWDAEKIKYAPEGTVLTKTYNFSYLDYRMDYSPDDYSQGKTEILLKKADGKAKMNVIKYIFD